MIVNMSIVNISIISLPARKLGGYDVNSSEYRSLQSDFEAYIKHVLSKGNTVVGHTSISPGSDTAWAKALAAVKRESPDLVKLHTHIPRLNQPEQWSNAAKQLWSDIRQMSDNDTLYNPAVVTDKKEISQAYALAEQAILDTSNIVLAVNDRSDYYTNMALKNAKTKNLEIINIDPSRYFKNMPKATTKQPSSKTYAGTNKTPTASKAYKTSRASKTSKPRTPYNQPKTSASKKESSNIPNVPTFEEKQISRNRRTPSITYQQAQIGDIVSMRVRFRGSGFDDEPYNVIHKNQPFGFVNAKARPCVLLGENEGNVVLAPCYSAKNHPPQADMQHGGIELSDEEARDAQLLQKDGLGTYVSCANLIQVPKDEFYYSSFIGSMPLNTLHDYFQELVLYYEESKTNPHKWQKAFDMDRPETLVWTVNSSFDTAYQCVDIDHAKSINPEDPEVFLKKTGIELKQCREEVDRKTHADILLDLKLPENWESLNDRLNALEVHQKKAIHLNRLLISMTKESWAQEWLLHQKSRNLGLTTKENNFAQPGGFKTFRELVSGEVAADAKYEARRAEQQAKREAPAATPTTYQPEVKPKENEPIILTDEAPDF